MFYEEFPYPYIMHHPIIPQSPTIPIIFDPPSLLQITNKTLEQKITLFKNVNDQQLVSFTLQPLRKSIRTKQTLTYLNDYHYILPQTLSHSSPLLATGLGSNSSSTSHPLFNFLCYDSLPDAHKTFSMNVTIEFEPKTYKEEAKHPSWQTSMKKEIQAVQSNNT